MSTPTVDAKRVLKKALPLAALASAGLNLVLYGVVTRVLGLPLAITQEPGAPLEPLGVGPVISASVVPAVVAALLLIVLGRFLRRPVMVFIIISVIALIATMAGPLNVSVDAATTRWVLAAMHVVAAASIVVVLVRRGTVTRKVGAS
ncbi:MAG: DUF6069 family protein [Verrucomicrobiales bacterium]|nr:DUF6069 family protein [Verrucomicrobiales bacterium]